MTGEKEVKSLSDLDFLSGGKSTPSSSSEKFKSLRNDVLSERYGWRTFLSCSFMDKYKIPPRSFELLQSNTQMVKLVDELVRKSCSLDPDTNFNFHNCVSGVDSHFDDKKSQIVICTNNFLDEPHLERSLGNNECFF